MFVYGISNVDGLGVLTGFPLQSFVRASQKDFHFNPLGSYLNKNIEFS